MRTSKRSITLRIRGGLGNQLFQVLALEKLAEKSNRRPIIDISWYNNKVNLDSGLSKRHFELQEFIRDVEIQNPPRKNCQLNIWIERITKMFPRLGQVTFGYLIEPKTINRAITFRKNISVYGYWLDAKTFPSSHAQIRPRIMDFLETNVKNKKIRELLDRVVGEDKIVLHVRGTDYLTFDEVFVTLDKSYYLAAINRIKDARKVSNLEIIVLSDDYNYSKRLLADIPFPIYFVSNSFELNHFETLYIMSKSLNLICSNSTFAWWGAFINTNFDSIMTFPKEYMHGVSSSEVFAKPKNLEFVL
jgi:hypothetical protein